MGARPVSVAQPAAPHLPGARDAGDHRLPSADHHAGDPGDPGRRPDVGAGGAARQEAGAGPGTQEGRGQAIALRHDTGVPGALRAEFTGGPARHRRVRNAGPGCRIASIRIRHAARRRGTRVDPDRDMVRVDGHRGQGGGRRVYYLLHKPKGSITSSADPAGRPTVLDLLQGVRERVFPVGRLDWNSEGLLILTNDGDLAFRLTHPGNHLPKVYRVKVKGAVTAHDMEALRRGMFLDGRRTLPARVERVSGQANTWLEVTLYEGRKNQIRRLFDRLGHGVLKLKRIAIGPIRDRALKPGEWRRLTPEEVRRLREAS